MHMTNSKGIGYIDSFSNILKLKEIGKSERFKNGLINQDKNYPFQKLPSVICLTLKKRNKLKSICKFF